LVPPGYGNIQHLLNWQLDARFTHYHDCTSDFAEQYDQLPCSLFKGKVPPWGVWLATPSCWHSELPTSSSNTAKLNVSCKCPFFTRRWGSVGQQQLQGVASIDTSLSASSFPLQQNLTSGDMASTDSLERDFTPGSSAVT